MKITIELNGVKVEKDIPTMWKEVTFGQFLKLSECEDDISKILSLLTGIEVETLNKAKIQNLEKIITLLSFLKTEMTLEVPKTCMGYEIPKNLEFETIGQFEDLKLEALQMKDIKSFEKYALFCAIYAVKEYDYKKAEELAPVFLNAPCEEVMAIGNFTLLKLTELTSGIEVNWPPRNTLTRKLWLAFNAYRRNLAFTVRYFIWKKKLRLRERSY